MTADATIQVWVAAQAGHGGAGPQRVVPYVQTVQVKRLRYRIELVNPGNGGATTRIRQSGELTTAAGKPTEISELAVAPHERDRCSITVDLSEEGAVIGTYSFDCGGKPLPEAAPDRRPDPPPERGPR